VVCYKSVTGVTRCSAVRFGVFGLAWREGRRPNLKLATDQWLQYNVLEPTRAYPFQTLLCDSRIEKSTWNGESATTAGISSEVASARRPSTYCGRTRTRSRSTVSTTYGTQISLWTVARERQGIHTKATIRHLCRPAI
jgi:hypothetical protein